MTETTVEMSATLGGDDNLCHDPAHVCPGCRPELFPESAERMDERHMAVRFGDHRPVKIVLLNGRDISMDAYEIVVGQEGWAYAYTQHPKGKAMHGCGHRDICSEVLRGSVMLGVR